MAWSLEEAVSYYKTQGAPKDQNAIISLLREIQQENDGSIPQYMLNLVADFYAIKESLLQALIKRVPSLRIGNSHCLELCAGPNCGKHTALADIAESLCKKAGGTVTLKFTPCKRMCGKGPNIKWDGKLYHHATEDMLKKLREGKNE